MKFGIIVLVLFGILAAGAATVLVQSASFLGKKREAPMVDVLVAVSDLPSRTALKEDLVEVRKMKATGLPRDVLSNWSQVAGKMLKMAVVAGQPLASSSFIPKNNVDELLRPGMLAFPAPLTTRNTAVDLLYPGCVVDVFATFPLRDRDKGDAVVTPLLQNIQVLAIASDTVMPAANEKGKDTIAKTPARRTSSGNITVTLEVTARQAAALQLALDKGTLGLAMRNPNDKGWNPMEPMVIKEGQLTASSEALDPQTLAWVASIQRMLNPEMAPEPNAVQAIVGTEPVAGVPDVVVVRPDPQVIPGMQSQKSSTQITIIRGQKVEETEIQTEPNEASVGQEIVKDSSGI